MLGKEADSGPRLPVSRRTSQDLCFAASRADKIEQHLYRRALPRSVWTQEAENFAAADLERQTANRDFIGKYFAETPGRNGKPG